MNKGEKTGICIDPNTGKEIEICGDERIVRAIRNLSKFGFITFSRRTESKSSKYTIHFFQPIERLKNLYNLGNEMLIVCTVDGMRDFKSRTKDYIDNVLISKGEFKNRLDKVTCFLIDGNKEVVSIVKSDRIDNPDARLIVPFCIDELQNGFDEDFLQERMRDFLYERDLFGIASPLNDETFFFGRNRHDIISELYGKYMQGEHGGLFGLRRIGKTSVLNLLKKRINANGGKAVYFDCSRYHMYRWYEFLGKISKRIMEECETSDKTGDGHLSFSLGDILGNPNKYDEKSAIESFESDLKDIYSKIGNQRILIILDEIENIGFDTSPNAHWKTENDALFFWQALRSISQTNNALFSFLVAGVNPMCVEISRINEHDNPIFGVLKPIYMPLFAYEDIKEMVNSIGGHLGLGFEEPLYGELMSDYGGHPFLTRQICSRINSDLLRDRIPRPTIVTKHSYEVHSDEYQMDMHQIIEQILLVLEKSYSIEFELLKVLALNGYKSFQKEIKGNEKAIPHLLGYCLIEKERDGYYIRIKSVERFLINKYLFEKDLTSQHDKRMRLNKRRDLLETKLREIIFYTLQPLYGKKTKERILEYIKGSTTDATQYGKIAKATPRDAMKELYFSQLKIIILKDWKHYNNIFHDQKRFEIFFDEINKSRGAGDHSRDISEEDEAVYNLAFKFFEEALEDY